MAALAAFIWLGSIVSVEDWRTGKILNRRIAQGLGIWAVTLLGLVAVSALHHFAPLLLQSWTSTLGNRIAFYIARWTSPALVRSFYSDYLFHAALMLCAGVVSWKIGCWPAGDAKFFIFAGLLLPLVDPHLKFFPDKLYFVLLLNIFVPACLWFIFQLGGVMGMKLLSSRWEGGLALIKERALAWIEKEKAAMRPDITGYCFMLLNFFILFSISQSLRQHATHWLGKFLHNEILVFVVLFVLWDKVYGVMMRKNTTMAFLVLMGAYMAAGALFFPDHILADIVHGMGMVLRIGMLLMLVKSAITWYFVTMEVRHIPASELAQGMVLSAETMASIREDNTFYEDCFQDTYSDGLTHLQVAKLQSWNHQESVAIYQTKPFAFWITVGTLGTLALKMDLMNFMRMSMPKIYSALGFLFAGGGH